jgi:hypothetical protein
MEHNHKENISKNISNLIKSYEIRYIEFHLMEHNHEENPFKNFIQKTPNVLLY